MNRPFSPQVGATKTLSVTQTTGNTAIDAGESLLLQNTGTDVCYVELGTSAVEATTGDMPVQGGQSIVIARPASATHIAAVCATGDTTTLLVTPGHGGQ